MKGRQSKFYEAGSWECPQCFMSNFLRKLWCMECNLPRQTEGEKDVRAADQINREELEEESKKDNTKNRKATAEEEVKEVQKKREDIMKGEQSMFENAGSWESPLCFMSNFARKLWCMECNLPRQTEGEKDMRAADQINREELEEESKKDNTKDRKATAEEEVKEVRLKREDIVKRGQSMFENAGIWECPQCFRSNLARRLWCLGCKLLRQTEGEKDVRSADQVNRREYVSRKDATTEERKAEKRRKAGGNGSCSRSQGVCADREWGPLGIFPSLF
jgi:hypothetical protein